MVKTVMIVGAVMVGCGVLFKVFQLMYLSSIGYDMSSYSPYALLVGFIGAMTFLFVAYRTGNVFLITLAVMGILYSAFLFGIRTERIDPQELNQTIPDISNMGQSLPPTVQVVSKASLGGGLPETESSTVVEPDTNKVDPGTNPNEQSKPKYSNPITKNIDRLFSSYDVVYGNSKEYNAWARGAKHYL